jgi:hypothetical protein
VVSSDPEVRYSEWVHSVALYGTQCGTIRYTVWHYMVHSVALFGTQCGTVWYTVWHCTVHSVALYGTQCGTIRYTVWHYTVHSVALYGTQCGTVRYTVWHYTVHCGTVQCHTVYNSTVCLAHYVTNRIIWENYPEHEVGVRDSWCIV